MPDRLLEFMQSVELPRRLTLYAWSTAGVGYDGHEDCLDEWARLTGSTPISLGGSLIDIQHELQRVRRLHLHGIDVNLCVHVSPLVPGPKLSVIEAMLKLRDRWREVNALIGRDAEIAVVYVDLEGFGYDSTFPPTEESQWRNRDVGKYNRLVYKCCKAAVGRSVDVRRFLHLGIERTGWWPATKRYTHDYTPSDGGWDCQMYEPTNQQKCVQTLRDTVAHARPVSGGSVWLLLGATEINWDCPGLQEYPCVAGNVHAVPYDPLLSHLLGLYFGNPTAFSQCPEFADVHSVVIWPGLFHSQMRRTFPWHLEAFLRGLTGKPFDPALRELQADAWGRLGAEDKRNV